MSRPQAIAAQPSCEAELRPRNRVRRASNEPAHFQPDPIQNTARMIREGIRVWLKSSRRAGAKSLCAIGLIPKPDRRIDDQAVCRTRDRGAAIRDLVPVARPRDGSARARAAPTATAAFKATATKCGVMS